MGDEPYQEWEIEWTPELREKSKDWANSNNAISESEFRDNPYSVIYYDFYKKDGIEKQLLKNPCQRSKSKSSSPKSKPLASPNISIKLNFPN